MPRLFYSCYDYFNLKSRNRFQLYENDRNFVSKSSGNAMVNEGTLLLFRCGTAVYVLIMYSVFVDFVADMPVSRYSHGVFVLVFNPIWTGRTSI